MKFKEGDKVICIDAGKKDPMFSTTLELNKQYTIDTYGADKIEPRVRLVEKTRPHDIFYAYRFKLDTVYYRKEKIKKLKNEI
jgi:hypothetical protein